MKTLHSFVLRTWSVNYVVIKKKTPLLKVNAIFKDVGVNNITVQVEKQSFFQHMSGLGYSTDQMIELAQHMTSLNQQDTSNSIKAI